MENIQNKQTASEATGYVAGIGISAARAAFRGKHVSAAIIVLAGAVLILRGSYIRHDDTKLFVLVVGCLFSAAGLAGWFLSSSSK